MFSFAVVRPVSSRLLQLQAAAKKLEEGELDTRVAIGGHDEVAEVAQAFNAMADELERRTKALPKPPIDCDASWSRTCPTS